VQQSQREAALAVHAVLDGAALPAALEANVGRDAGPARAFVQELAYGTLRHHGTLDAVVRAMIDRPIPDRRIAALVEVALYQLEHTRQPPFAVVDQAVAAAAGLANPGAKSLVNALLRRFLRERADVLARVQADPVARWSHPHWWIARVRADWPDDWMSILDAGNARPPLALRANRRHGDREALLARFVAEGIDARAEGDAGIVVATPRPVAALPGFAEGAFSVQDLGAQLAAPLLDARDGMRVLDACAAPGGKTSHVLELADVAMTALDSDATRLQRVRDNLARLGLDRSRLSVLEGDATRPERWWDGAQFDRVIADVPCTASGVVRRHPDAKWLRRATDVGAFAGTQRAILEALWPLLARDGVLLYATCSVFREENEARIAEFTARHPDALREPITFPAGIRRSGGQLLPSPETAGHNQDGFFYARLRKA
jgi:16S rRNA (cytosine967-C5)-methyltransferase